MFHKRIAEITLDDVQVFCREWGEGVRVEYKNQMIENIPKTISAFANTLGGVIVIGVNPDKARNRVIFPIEGMDVQEGIEEKITQRSIQGIYPGIVPDIKVLEVPDKPGKIVVVVKVHETLEAPHAIQNSTRVYI